MTKLTEQHKKEIIQKIEQKKDNLGTYGAVATFCNVSESTINLMSRDQYQAKGDAMWIEIGTKLGWSPDNRTEWKLVETADCLNVWKIATDAKNNSLFLAMSDLAGMGKSSPLKWFAEKNKNAAVFYLRCMDWGKKEFMENLCRTLGIDTGRGFKTPNRLIELVIEFFSQRTMQRPLLIIDEADKLKAAAKRFLIPLYNELEDMLGVLIAGTDNLEKEIKTGVKYQSKGYDEIDSRFGRRYIKLNGCNLNDVGKICKANGIIDQDMIANFFEECQPVRKAINIKGKQSTIRVISDLRRLKRLVKREQLNTLNS